MPTAQLDELLADGKEVDIEALLLGRQWLLSIKHNEANGRVYDNVVNTMKAPPQQRLSVWDDTDSL